MALPKLKKVTEKNVVKGSNPPNNLIVPARFYNAAVDKIEDHELRIIEIGEDFFKDGGNSFGADAIIGTNDAFDLTIKSGADLIETITGNKTVNAVGYTGTFTGNYLDSVTGTYSLEVVADINIQSTASIELITDNITGGDVRMQSGTAQAHLHAATIVNITADTDDVVITSTAADIILTAGGAINLDGNAAIGGTTFGTNATNTFAINNGVAPTTSIAGGIQIHSKDSSDGLTNATLALFTEQAVETIGTFTASDKLKIWINGVEYWIQLDAV